MSELSDTRTEWTTYDELHGPELDPALWEPLDFGYGPRVEPKAMTTVQDGVVTIDIPTFTASDDGNQGLDNSKHVMFSTEGFSIPEGGVASFSADLRSEICDGSHCGDYRYGFASFNVVDSTGGTHTVFNILSTGERVFAEQELLYPAEQPFTRVIEDPFFFSRRGAHPGDGFRHCETEIDRARGRVTYRVDGEILHVAAGLTNLPGEVHIALGIFTLLPLGEGEGSAHGQGGRASWRNIRYRLTGQ